MANPTGIAVRIIAVFAAVAAVLFTALSLAAPAAAQTVPAGTNLVTGTRLVGDGERTRFVADLTDEVALTVFALANPNRIVIDLPEVHFQLPQGTGETGRGLVSAYRFGLISAGRSRIVLDLAGPAAVEDYEVIAAAEGQPPRLVVDLVRSTQTAFVEAAEAYRETAPAPVPLARPPTGLIDGAGDGRYVIVIDPGHGGIDAGAVGADGALEKDVVLAFATILAEQLRATGRYEVAMTRTGDTFPSLNDRVAFARDRRADLMLSIHADWLGDRSVRGAAVYTISDRASDQVSAELAASENRADILAGIQLANAPAVVTDVLIDLARRETVNFSIMFARDLVDRIGDVTRLINNPHRQAGFVVLTAPDVPSVLVELGFLSNPDDEATLLSERWQERTADAMVDAIDAFFSTRVARF